MNIKLNLYTGALVLSSSLLASISVQAAVLGSAGLPAAIQGCEASGNCIADIATHLDLPGMTAVELTRYDVGTGMLTQSWLLRYNLYAPSASTYWDNYSGVDTTTVTPYTGNIWMEAPKLLDLGGPNLFNIYTDHINPDPDGANPTLDSTFVFSMSALDAMSGGASYYNSGDNGSGAAVITNGSLRIIDGIFTCVECGINVSLNLVGLDYSTGSANFNPADARVSLLQYSDFFDLFTNDRTFKVSPVPVPASIWLFASGLLGLFQLARKKRTV
ncbi:MAG: hypothetical protein GXP11_08045 [Gammaproteobacteria bacterium]|nr:hypothetical protein [Gammaproteobacteria bacterium]